jgi:hypothetical protein
LKFQNATLPIVKPEDFSEKEDDRYKPFSLRKLIYTIAAIHIQGQIPTVFVTEGSADPGTDAAVALIEDFIKFKATLIDQNESLSEDEKENQKTLDSFEMVRFYLFVGQYDQARAIYDSVFAGIRGIFNTLPKHVKDGINSLRDEIPQTTKVFLAFNIEEILTRLRLAPTSEAKNLVDYIAISYQETGTKVRLAHQVETIAGRKRYGFTLQEAGKYICFIDILEVKAEAIDKIPVEIVFNRGTYSEDVIHAPLKNTEPQFTFTQRELENPKPIMITPNDFDENKLLKEKRFTKAPYQGDIKCSLDLLVQTSYNFNIKPYIPGSTRPMWAIAITLHTAAIVASIFSF